MRENVDQKNFEYGYFLRSEKFSEKHSRWSLVLAKFTNLNTYVLPEIAQNFQNMY